LLKALVLLYLLSQYIWPNTHFTTYSW